MDPVLQALVTALVSFLTASAGYWGYLWKQREKRDDQREQLVFLLMGLSQIRIIELGMQYIDAGCVTKDQYQDLRRYLYEPYCKLGGNGTVERIMHAVERLPFESGRSVLEKAFQDIPIREDDPTGLPTDKIHYKGEERRGQRRE